ncbi:MAG: hypothetical protein JO261_11625 [Alphaproteobacteria bacterium]|nr:hypothetical protein [Alphaproteobacteria bacterium]MBV9694338.1 hypothetical protein [Alphaproteobacteria bacterium]
MTPPVNFRVLALALTVALATSSALAQQDDCKTGIARLTTAQSAVESAHTKALSLFLTFGIASTMQGEKQKAYFAELCRPDGLADFDNAATALDDATAAATKAETLCPIGREHDNASALHKQYVEMNESAAGMKSTAMKMCGEVLH